MRIESITVLIVLFKQILCDWEVYVNELGSLAQSNYTNWIDTTTNLPITQMACGTGMTQFIAKGEHDISRIINMPAKNYDKIQISFDLYFFGDWLGTSQISVYINNILYQAQGHKQLSTDIGATRMCYQVGGVGVDYLQRVQFEQQLDDLTLNILIRANKIASEIYGISNFVLLINSLEIPNCQSYHISTHDCIKCQDGFTLKNLGCECQEFSYYNPGLTCVSRCPIGTAFDDNRFCQPTTQITLFEDLNLPGFPSYTFDYTPDEKYTQYTGTKIISIDGLNVAGQFWNNDMISYSPINISGSQKIILSFIVYFVGAQPDSKLYKNKYNQVLVGSHIEIFFNNYLMTDIIYFDREQIMISGNFFLSKYQTCTYPTIQNCYYYDVQIQYDIVDPIVQLVFKGHFTINNANSFWAIRDLTIKSYLMTSILPSCMPPCQTCTSNLNFCLTCTFPLLAYNGICLSTCPDFAPNIGNVCVDTDITTNVEYVYNQFYGMQGFNFQDDFTFSPSPSSSLNEIFYTNYLNKYTMLGGFQIWDYDEQIIMNKINLPIFYGVRVRFQLLLIDHVQVSGSTYFELGINSSPLIDIQDTTPFFSQGNQFGFSDPEYLGEVNQYVSFVSTNSLTITLRCLKQATQRNCGIYNLRVYISKCPQYCLNCDSAGVCITYINTISTDSTGCKSGYYNDLVKNECISCWESCLTCTSSNYCTSCKPDFELFQNTCFCNKNFANLPTCTANCRIGCLACVNDTQCMKCDTSLNLWLNVDKCVCQDGYYMENDLKCYDCYPTCKTCIKTPRLCMSCDSTQLRHLAYQGCECNDGYFQQDALLTCQICDTLCKTCKLSKSICTSCQLSHFRALASNKCICANGYYEVGVLICEKCPDTCETCSNSSTCLTCKASQNRQLSILGSKCVCTSAHYELTTTPICQSCHTSCQECQLSSLSTQCIRCPITREPSQGAATFSCKCKKGYYEANSLECLDCANYVNPPSTHYCFSHCGDGIVQWDEDCDDKNLNTRDGCVNCLFSTSHCLDESCSSCHASQCTSCKDGYYLGKDSICHVCDSICQKCVTRSDNCTACTLLKPDGSGCLLCQESRGYKIEGDTCLNICGDGIKVSGEKCDDGNIKKGDGCSDTCEVEDGWICDLGCEKIVYPIIQLEENNLDSIYEGMRRIMLTISEPVQVTGDLLSNLKIEVFNSSSFEIQTIDSTNKTEVYQTVKLEIIVTLQVAMTKPILVVTIINMDSITNQQGFSLKNPVSNFEMLQFKLQSDGVKATTEGLMGLSQYVLYLLFGLAILAFLFGGMNIFWNLLDALQLICYLKYFNVQYPYNIQNYLILFGFAEFDFLKQYINLEEYISNYVDTPNASEKFYDEGYSTVFIVNIVSVIIVFITTLLTFLGCKVLFYLLKKIASTLTLDSIDECEQSVLQFFIYRVTRNLELSLMRMTSEIGSGLLRTFMAVAFDYNIAIFLQLKDFHYDNGILLFSSLLGLVAFIVEIIFLYKSFVFMSKPKYVYELQSIQNNYGALYEGLVIGKNPFTYHYNILLLSKKMIFMFFLVFLYDAPCLQVGMVSMLNLVMAAYLQKNKPLEEADEQLKNVGSELFIWVAELLILLLAMNEQSRTLDDDQQSLIGWFVIVFCTFLIFFQLVLDVKQHVNFLMKEQKIIQKLVDRFKLFLNKQEPDQESNIFLRNQRNMIGNSKKSKSLKMRKVVTFSLSSSSS